MRIVAPMPLEGGPRIPKNLISLKNGKKSSKTEKLKNVQKYSKISDTPFDQRSLIHREAWFPGGPRIPQNPIFLKNGKNSSKTQKLKLLEICQNQRYALRPEVSNPSGSVVSGWTKNSPKSDFFEKRKKFIQNAKTKTFRDMPKLAIRPSTRGL